MGIKTKDVNQNFGLASFYCIFNKVLPEIYTVLLTWSTLHAIHLFCMLCDKVRAIWYYCHYLLWLPSLLYLVSCCCSCFCCCWRFCCCWDPVVVDILSLPGVSAILIVPFVVDIPSVLTLNAVVRILKLLKSWCCWHLFCVSTLFASPLLWRLLCCGVMLLLAFLLFFRSCCC